MSTFAIIQQKLEQFIKKYYTNALIKGSLLFLATGLLYLLVTLLVEHFLWLDSTGRAILFWAFVGVALLLFVRFIAFPLTRLFHLQKGISHEDASQLIGSHFPEVSDKLLNVIQLNQNQRESELLAASIDQKAAELQPIPFKSAINYAGNLPYLKYVAIPVLLFVVISVLGGKDLFTDSYKRVVNYDTAYEPPAPFAFFLENESLNAIQHQSFTLRVATSGDIIPETAYLSYDGQRFLMKPVGPGLFEYEFKRPNEDLQFRLIANKVSSIPYTLNVIEVPTLVAMEMQLDYPAYTGKADEALSNSGNATVPEGTKVTWNLQTVQTQQAQLKTRDSIYAFQGQEGDFTLNQRLFQDLDYAITTSNEQLKEYENLNFAISVVKDEYPNIQMSSRKDSLDDQVTYFLGRISDDYGLSKLDLVYYPSGEENRSQREPLPLNSGTFDQFVATFPGGLNLEKGVAYEYYFEVFDNDGLRGGKSSKSGVFSYRVLTDSETEDKQLEQQQQTIDDLDESLKDMKEREALLKELAKTQKEKANLNWNDKKKLQNFFKRQEQQDDMMKKFSKQLEENLDEFQQDEDDPFKKQLQDRLNENEEMLQQNEELLKELQELQEKINKEDLSQKLERLAKNNKNQEKNLEQLLELTKRYYVSQKAQKISNDLQELGKKQEELGKKSEDDKSKDEDSGDEDSGDEESGDEESDEENSEEGDADSEDSDGDDLKKQQEYNEAFQDLKKQLDELRKSNEELKEPMPIPQDKTGENEVQEDQQKATESLQQNNKQQASPKQQKAGQKMQQMGQQMQQQMAGGSQESIEEDVDMLRQILDNLVVFSFEQEELMDDFKRIDYNSAIFSTKLKVQNNLKQHFEHIDDSLFALALRQPMIGNSINELLTDVEFNIDKSLERLAENRVMMGVTSQQYTVTRANDLAVLLSSILGNMQNQMMMGAGAGSGSQGRGFQLPDIIQKQESLNEKMKKGNKKGKKGEGEGQGQGQGEGEGEGEGEGQGEGQGEGNGESEGQGSNDGSGESNGGSDEDMNGELFRIYQEQQMLRKQLEDKMGKEGLKGAGGDLLKKMEQVEQELLDKGFNDRTLQKMTELKYEMLKLDEATFEQGQEQRRESTTNNKDFTNPLLPSSLDVKKYFNTTEILNRQALPMRQDYKKRVQEYFKGQDG